MSTYCEVELTEICSENEISVTYNVKVEDGDILIGFSHLPINYMTCYNLYRLYRSDKNFGKLIYRLTDELGIVYEVAPGSSVYTVVEYKYDDEPYRPHCIYLLRNSTPEQKAKCADHKSFKHQISKYEERNGDFEFTESLNKLIMSDPKSTLLSQELEDALSGDDQSKVMYDNYSYSAISVKIWTARVNQVARWKELVDEVTKL